MSISVSILEYEQTLYENIDDISISPVFGHIIKMINTGKMGSIHLDIMRPPLIPNRIVFPIKLVEKIYETLRRRISLSFHLMVPDPVIIIDEMNEFIPKKDRIKSFVTIHRESFSSENEITDAVKLIKEYGYGNVGVGLDLPTPCNAISERTVRTADFILLMTVHMGRGRQKYSEKGTEKIDYFSRKYPEKPIWVDGGINPHTARIAEKAGARILVVGSFITLKKNPVGGLLELANSIGE